MWLGQGMTVQPPRAAITVSALNADGQKLSEALAHQLKDIASKLPGFEIVKLDLEHGEYEIRFVSPSHQRVRQRCVGLPQENPGQFTVITLWATEETFEFFRSDMDKAVAQFREEQQNLQPQIQ